MKLYRLLGAGLGWFTLVAQYYLNVQQDGLLAGSVVYFGFFTILGNLMVALAFAAPLPGGGGLVARFFERPGVRTAIAIYILVVGVIFYLLLRDVYRPVGFGWWLNISLHYTMPPLYLLDWVLFVDKRALRLGQIGFWLIFPLVYAVYVLIHGRISGYYPYPFLDVRQFGYGRVFVNMAGLSLMFALLGVVFVGLGRMLGAGLRARRDALN